MTKKHASLDNHGYFMISIYLSKFILTMRRDTTNKPLLSYPKLHFSKGRPGSRCLPKEKKIYMKRKEKKQ